MKFYKGTFTPKNPNKYRGDNTNIVYRSSWERAVFKWLDSNSSIEWWNSEEVVITYICATDNKQHRYFIDIAFRTTNGKTYLIEIKPSKQTKPPKVQKRTKKSIQEQLTYAKNQSKWNAALAFAKNNNCVFQVWTEETLRSLGIKIL